jgi:hypothetical protein
MLSPWTCWSSSITFIKIIFLLLMIIIASMGISRYAVLMIHYIVYESLFVILIQVRSSAVMIQLSLVDHLWVIIIYPTLMFNQFIRYCLLYYKVGLIVETFLWQFLFWFAIKEDEDEDILWHTPIKGEKCLDNEMVLQFYLTMSFNSTSQLSKR